MEDPKEKAKQLIRKFNNIESEAPCFIISVSQSKKAALIAVDEVLNKDGYNNHYWQEVKEYLQNSQIEN